MSSPPPGLDWSAIAGELEAEGHAVLEGLLAPARCRALVAAVDGMADRQQSPHLDPDTCRLLQNWDDDFRRRLAPLATRWREMLGHEDRPAALPGITCGSGHDMAPPAPPVRIDRLRAGDAVGLHRHADAPDALAFRLVALLSEPGRDFTGGELVLVEQRPRLQSRPVVVPLRSGDVTLICATRPIQGTRGVYPGRLSQAISRVHGGTRIGLELALDEVR